MLTLVIVPVTNKAVVMQVDFISYLGTRGMCSGCLPALQPRYTSHAAQILLHFLYCCNMLHTVLNLILNCLCVTAVRFSVHHVDRLKMVIF